MNWKYYKPKFEFNNELASSWWGHTFFAYDLVRNLRPKKIVELGTYNGVSLFSFCQAVKDGELETEINAVDTWEGDKHAGFYGKDVLHRVEYEVGRSYSDLNINLLKKTFDEALNKFSDKSIDLLHIDGLHTYEAVKNDFNKWVKKVNDDGVIIFHDIHEKRDDFGVYKLWIELRKKYKTIEFYHWHGLGVLFLSEKKFYKFINNRHSFVGYYTNISDKDIFRKLRVVNNKSLELRKKLEGNIEKLKHEIKIKEDEIKFMKSSKFWKLREKQVEVKGKTKAIAMKYFRVLVDVVKKMVPKSIRHKYGHFYNNLFSVKHDSGFSLSKMDAPIEIGKKKHIYDIFNFGVIDWDFRIQRPQHIARGLAKKGNRIFYIKTNVIPVETSGMGFDQIKRMVRVENDENDIYKVSLVSKNKLNIYKDSISDPDDLLYLKYSIDAVKEKFNIGSSISKVDLPFWGKLAFNMDDTKIVYDCMDDHSGFENNTEEMVKEEDELVKKSDLVITTSNLLFDKMSRKNKNILMAKNAAEVDKFKILKENDKIGNIKKPIVGYYGAISDWFDYDLIEFCAKKKPKINFVLIGRTCENPGVDKLKKLPNVHFLGEKPYEEIADYLYHFDVCTIPFKIIPLILATNPVKFFEYISSGKPVVSVDLPELHEYSDISYLAKSKEGFLSGIEKALAEKDNEDVVEKRKKTAKDNTWEKRVDVILDKINSAFYPKISLVMVTYNNINYTKKCLDSIFRKTNYPNYEVIIVDNNSTDETPEYLKDVEKDNINVKIILNNENRGFAGGNNDGLEIATGEYIVLINNDTIVTENWLKDIKKILDDNPNLGMLGPVSNSVGNIQMIPVDYKDVKDMDDWSERFTGAKSYSYKKMLMLGFFCVAMKREVYRKVGDLDENYNVGMFEDDDYCERVRKAGYDLGYTEKVFIHHFGSVSFKKLEDENYKKIFETNKKYFEKKWNKKWIPNIDGKIKNKSKNN